jgi:hypothetical protein
VDRSWEWSLHGSGALKHIVMYVAVELNHIVLCVAVELNRNVIVAVELSMK